MRWVADLIVMYLYLSGTVLAASEVTLIEREERVGVGLWEMEKGKKSRGWSFVPHVVCEFEVVADCCEESCCPHSQGQKEDIGS